MYKTMKFIGDKKIKGTLELPNKRIKVMFKDNTDIEINSNLFKIIAHKEKRDGGITDRVRLVLATKFLQEMADYGLEFYFISHIGQGMETLAHNIREDMFGKAFDCKGLNDININKLLDEKELEKND